MQGTLVQQGIELMLFGMGTVFVFLSLLVIFTGLMSSLLQRYVKPEPVVAAGSRIVVAQQNDGRDERIMAVISAALHKHRSRNNK